MRRRNSPRVVWLPQTALNSIAADSVYQAGTVAVAGDTGGGVIFEIPLVRDTQKGFSDDASLADIESSGYRLRRIVGKLWFQYTQNNNNSPAQIIVTAGIIVRHADTASGQSLAFLAGPTQVDPGTIDNTGDPWVWRRSWVLTNNIAIAWGGQSPDLPTSNWSKQSGGNADGPHVDQKTARIVGPEERLFLNVAATVFIESGVPATSTNLTFMSDLRVLGSLRTSSGNRRNASR